MGLLNSIRKAEGTGKPDRKALLRPTSNFSPKESLLVGLFFVSYSQTEVN